MSDRGSLENLKQEIVENIYTNENQAVTGDLLQDVLIDAVDTMGVSVSQNTNTGAPGGASISIGGNTYNLIDKELRDNIYKTVEVNISDYNEDNYWVNTSGIYTTGGKSVNVPLDGNSNYVTVKANANTSAVIAFLKSAPEVGESVEFAGDYSAIILVEIADGEKTFLIPNNATILNVLTYYNVDKTPSILNLDNSRFVLMQDYEKSTIANNAIMLQRNDFVKFEQGNIVADGSDGSSSDSDYNKRIRSNCVLLSAGQSLLIHTSSNQSLAVLRYSADGSFLDATWYDSDTVVANIEKGLYRFCVKNNNGADITPMSNRCVCVCEKWINNYNVQFMLDGNSTPQLPAFDTTDMTLTFSSSGGGFMIDGIFFPFPSLERRELSLSGIGNTVINVLYDMATNTFTARGYNEGIKRYEVLLAVVRVDSANTPTTINNVSAIFDYTIDGKLYSSGGAKITAESITEPILLPYFRTAIKLGDEILQEIQSMTVVGNELWVASGEPDTVNGGFFGYIYRYNKNTYEYIGRLSHRLDHMNSMSYDENTDRMIVGGTDSNSNKIYIYGNVSNWATLYAETDITINDVLVATITLNTGTTSYSCPCWGEANADGHRFIYVSHNLNACWRKIKLTYDANGVPTGAYTDIWTKNLVVPSEVNTYALACLPEYSGTSVCQDLAYHKGVIYANASVAANQTLKIAISDDALKVQLIRNNYLKDNGTYPTNCANNGITFVGDKMLVGICNIRNTTENDYSNRILEMM